jgi:outer membrane putative beta-barrel porin/alpha-amylase
MSKRLRVFAVLLTLCGSAWPAEARQSQTPQGPQTVAEIVDFLMTNQAVQTGDFERDRAAAEAARDAISRALQINLTSVPLASSSSGFLYRLNPTLGTMERATQSFGSFFVERALTIGAQHASFGMSFFTTGFDRLGDLQLRDGRAITTANQFRDEVSPFDTEALTLRIRSSTATLFGSYGVTDSLEVGAALPLIRLTLDGERLNVYRGDPFLQASANASATGIGDVALRAKYTVARSSSGAFAAAAEMRLPTGDEENLLGAGAAAFRFLGIGSVESGRLTLHGNGGIVIGGVSDELNFSGAGAFAVHPRVTVSGELLIRRVTELHDLRLVSEAHPTFVGVDTLRLVQGDSAATLANAVAGFKWNVNGTFVLGGHLAFPLVRHGLTATVTPTLALEYAF